MDRQTIGLDQEQVLETRELLKAAFLLARALEIRTLVLQQNELIDLQLVRDLRRNERIIWASRDGREWPSFDPSEDILLRVPHAALNRFGQINIALFLAALNGLVGPEERVLALSGVAGSRRLDTLIISKPERDYPMAAASKDRQSF